MAILKPEVVQERFRELTRSHYAYWTREDGTKMSAMRRRGVKTGLTWEVVHPTARAAHFSSTLGIARIIARFPEAYCI